MDCLSKSSEETKNFAGELAKGLKGGEVIALYGELGSGKTVFVQGLVRALGGREVEVTSPTFILHKEYKISFPVGKVSHLDFYRLDSLAELYDLGLEELFELEDRIIAIEWAEKAGNLLPEKRINVYFEYVDEKTRIIRIVRE